MSKIIKSGDVYRTNKGGTVTVVKYRNSSEVVIKHNDDYEHTATVTSHQLRKGKVKNPYQPCIHGVGFVGVGEHTAYINGKQTPAYTAWNNMLKRCYSDDHLTKYPTYRGCSVHPDWHNYQIFAEWFEQQYRADGWALDKDLIVGGNKTYSADTCIFIPQQLNTLLNDCGASRGGLPQGVSRNRKGFIARLRIDGITHCLGTYQIPEEAFQAYKVAKESNVKRMAEQYRGLIDHRVYESLMKYEVAQ